jgi:peptidylprolyl isomerase
MAADPENTLYLDLTYGRVVIELYPAIAPDHVKRIKMLTRDGFYNGVKFHRVIDDFMAQTGDPTGTGTGSSDYPDLYREYTDETKFVRGSLGMARGDHPDSGNSQFFICLSDDGQLNGRYTMFGKVVSGMEFVDRIKKGEPPVNPDIVVRLQVAADADPVKPVSATPQQ